MEKRKSFVVYTDLDDSLASFSNAEVGAIFRAMLTYADTGQESDLTDREAVAFGFIRAQMDRDFDKYDEIIEKRKAAGRARQEQANATKSKQVLPNATTCNQMQAQAADNDTVTDTVTDTENENVNGTVNGIVIPPLPPTGERAPAKRFEPPTVEEVAKYCKERNNGVDAQRFIDYYTANGWKVGRNAMKDWKAAVRSTWERGEDGGKRTKSAAAAPVKRDDRLLNRARAYQKEAET